MKLHLTKSAWVVSYMAVAFSLGYAQPSVQQINPNVALTLNSTSLLHSGQTVKVSFRF